MPSAKPEKEHLSHVEKDVQTLQMFPAVKLKDNPKCSRGCSPFICECER